MLSYKRVFVSTWNVGGEPPSDDLNLEDWLDINNNSYDIYVLGFQEVVPLSAKNVLGPERSWVSMKWNSLIRETLNKSLSEKKNIANEETKLGERKKLHQLREIAPSSCEGSSEKNAAENFRCIISKQMVGILASVWVRGDLWQYVHHPSVSCVGCGVMGCLGNKGAVSVRFYLHDTSFCFVCCHLASGGKEGDVLLRNSDMADIFARTRFPRCGSLDFPQKILDHEISLPESKTRFLVEQKMWNILLEKDELKSEVSVGRTFEGWNEGLITFSPTYKYYPNSDEYYGCTHNIKCEKRRAPAWCDRILWHGRGWKQTRYEKCDSRLSDHRPVRAVFSVEVEIVRSLSSLGSFFSSERLDCSVDDFNLQSNDGPNNKMSSL
ncbi:type IV inositol polyphosphate 5-phosphatase 9-like isoform X2 [Ananas comosus]|uniref:Type IV inositol polyphosphate 5-phosphatase 9-like isoform X2 n=1 Tax=Ananas comosus TaxID=4615 RepID=A0A6P5GWI7_ANACO|nr:type IV inositol polyphosphate 5-phosphatase 9-like isoform X2 [Ananas comosus]